MTGRSLKEKWLLLQMIVTDRSLTPGTKIVAARLLHHFNSQHGRCDPGYETLAEGTGYDRRAVMRRVKSLIDAGYLRRTRREVAPGLNSSNSYEFAWDRLSGDLSITMEDEDGDTPITTSDPTDTTVATEESPPSDTAVTTGGDPKDTRGGDRGVTQIREYINRESEPGNVNREMNTGPRASRSSHDGVEEEDPSVEDEAGAIAGTTAPVDGELFPPGVDTNLLTNSDSARAREVAPGGSTRRKPPAYTSAEIERMFSAFWFQYPKKEGRGGAKKAFERIVKSRKVMPDVVLNGAMRYAAAKTDTDPQFIKGAARWLNEECWTDETPAPRAAGFAPRRNNSSDDMMRAFLNLRDGEIQ